jgi:hypothetical protein
VIAIILDDLDANRGGATHVDDAQQLRQFVLARIQVTFRETNESIITIIAIIGRRQKCVREG